MKNLEVECENCMVISTINEQKMHLSAEEHLEEAYCIECDEKLYEGYTSGWFFVESKKQKKKLDKECVYPMP
jgi:hypothetical protein